MWPAVPVTAWASIRPRASKTAADRSPTSRTMGVKEVRIRAAACSLATATSRLQRISRVTGSSAARLRLATADLDQDVAVLVGTGAAAEADDQRRLPLLDDGRPPYLLLGPQPVAIVDGRLHETAAPGVPDRPPPLSRHAGRRRRRDVEPGLGPGNAKPPGHHLHLDAWRSPAIERDVGSLERFLDQARRRAAQPWPQADRDSVALSAMAGVDLDLGARVAGPDAGAGETSDALPPHPVQHPPYVPPVHLRERRRQAAGEVEGGRRAQHPEGRGDARRGRTEDARNAKGPRHPERVHRPRAAGRYQRVAAQVAAALDRMHSGGCRHVLVDDPMDPGRRLLDAGPEPAREGNEGGLRSLDIQPHLTAEEEGWIEVAEHQVGVGDGGVPAAVAVAGRAGLRPGALRAHPRQPEAVHLGDAAAARPD